MKNEEKLHWEYVFRIMVAVIFAVLYAWGGMEHKWLRRFVAPAFLTLSMLIFSRDWKCLINLTMMGSLCLGYGAVETAVKVLRRIVFGLANGITSSAYNATLAIKDDTGDKEARWLLVGFHVVGMIVVSVVFGVWNPLPARGEELFIGLSMAVIPVMSARR